MYSPSCLYDGADSATQAVAQVGAPRYHEQHRGQKTRLPACLPACPSSVESIPVQRILVGCADLACLVAGPPPTAQVLAGLLLPVLSVLVVMLLWTLR